MKKIEVYVDEYPKSCYKCNLCEEKITCPITGTYINRCFDERSKDCPLKLLQEDKK